jgi:hypothetical protein
VKIIAFIKFIPKILDDVLLAVGIYFLSVGVYQIYIPAGNITLGVCFMAFAYLYAKRR